MLIEGLFDSMIYFTQAIISIPLEKSQTQLSNLTGITQPDISKLENSKVNPSVATLKKLATAFGKKYAFNLFDKMNLCPKRAHFFCLSELVLGEDK